MMRRAGRLLPESKTLGMGYNLRPDKKPVPARDVQVGDVVMEVPDHPAVVTESHMSSRGWLIRARYIWQEQHEPPWLMGHYEKAHLIQRAMRGEY